MCPLGSVGPEQVSDQTRGLIKETLETYQLGSGLGTRRKSGA